MSALLLNNVEETGKKLDHEAYGVVVKIRLSKLVCTGKTLHEAIVQVHILANDEMITISCFLFID